MALCINNPFRVLAGMQKRSCFGVLIQTTMKLLSESIRNFAEGFASFYTSLYKEVMKW
jgi:hypothetical protein